MEEIRGLWGIPTEALSNLFSNKKQSCTISSCVAQDMTVLVEGVQAVKKSSPITPQVDSYSPKAAML
jgi:hypothetical protein